MKYMSLKQLMLSIGAMALGLSAPVQGESCKVAASHVIQQLYRDILGRNLTPSELGTTRKLARLASPMNTVSAAKDVSLNP